MLHVELDRFCFWMDDRMIERLCDWREICFVKWRIFTEAIVHPLHSCYVQSKTPSKRLVLSVSYPLGLSVIAISAKKNFVKLMSSRHILSLTQSSIPDEKLHFRSSFVGYDLFLPWHFPKQHFKHRSAIDCTAHLLAADFKLSKIRTTCRHYLQSTKSKLYLSSL